MEKPEANGGPLASLSQSQSAISSSSTSGESSGDSNVSTTKIQEKLTQNWKHLVFWGCVITAVTFLLFKFANMSTARAILFFLSMAGIAVGNLLLKRNTLPFAHAFLVLFAAGLLIDSTVDPGFTKIQETIDWGDKAKQTQQVSVRPAPTPPPRDVAWNSIIVKKEPKYVARVYNGDVVYFQSSRAFKTKYLPSGDEYFNNATAKNETKFFPIYDCPLSGEEMQMMSLDDNPLQINFQIKHK